MSTRLTNSERCHRPYTTSVSIKPILGVTIKYPRPTHPALGFKPREFGIIRPHLIRATPPTWSLKSAPILSFYAKAGQNMQISSWGWRLYIYSPSGGPVFTPSPSYTYPKKACSRAVSTDQPILYGMDSLLTAYNYTPYLKGKTFWHACMDGQKSALSDV